MWVTTRKQQTASNNSGVGVAPKALTGRTIQTLDACISQRRRQLYKNRNTSGLRKEIKRLSKQVLEMNGRHQIRARADLEKELTTMQELVLRRETGEEEREFEEKVKPYVETYANLATVIPQKQRGVKRLAVAMTNPLKTIPTKQPRLTVDAAERKNYDQTSVQEEFLQEFENRAPPLCVVHGDICEPCGVAMIMMGNDSLLGCPTCGRTRVYIQATSSRIAYGEEVEFSSFSYKRLNHFLEWLATFQAKESTIVPQETIENVMEELHARRITEDKVTEKKVREILKYLKARKSYDHVPQITARITGRLPPRMTPYQEEQMTLMFQAIQDPFETHRPQGRRNFLSYAYCLYKFCELMGWDRFLRCFTLLKGRDKLRRQDMTYQKICGELGWEYIPSI